MVSIKFQQKTNEKLLKPNNFLNFGSGLETATGSFVV